LLERLKYGKYITLFRKIYLIDCPGVVHGSGNETDEEKVLKGVVRVEMVEQPSDYVPAVMKRVKKEYMARTYRLLKPWDWTSTSDFLERVARQSGKLLKGGEPDLNTVGKMILNDWQRGKIPYFSLPTGCELPSLDDTLPNGNLSNNESKSADQVENVESSVNNEDDHNNSAISQKQTSEESITEDKDTTSNNDIEVESNEIDSAKEDSLVNQIPIEHPDQDFRKIRVKIDFDEEDRRGEEYVESGEESVSEDNGGSSDENDDTSTPSLKDEKSKKIKHKQLSKKQKITDLRKVEENSSSQEKKRKLEKKSSRNKNTTTIKSSSGKFKISDI